MAKDNEWDVVGERPITKDDWNVVGERHISEQRAAPVDVPTEGELAATEQQAAAEEVKKPKTQQELLAEYNAERNKGQLLYGGAGAGAGLLTGAVTGLFPKATTPEAKEAANLAKELKKIQEVSGLEKTDLLRKLQSAGVDVSDLDNARLLEEAAPRLEAQLGAAEARAIQSGSTITPRIYTAPVSATPDIVDIIQHSAVGTGGTNVPETSSWGRQLGQHEKTHQYSQAAEESKKTAEQVAKSRGTSYGKVLAELPNYSNTASGRVLIPQQLNTKMVEDAVQALQVLTPERLAAEAEVRRLTALGKDTSKLTSKIAELQKQETLARHALTQAESMQPGVLTRTGMATGKFPKITGALGGLGTGLSVYDMYNADTLGELALGSVNTGLGAMSMVPPVNVPMAAVRGFGTLGSLAMFPVNIAAEIARRKGYFGKGSVMDQIPDKPAKKQ